MTLHQAPPPALLADAAVGMSLPLEAAVEPLPRLLEILASNPTTLSRTEADRLAAEASAEDLVGFLEHEDAATVERAVLILGLKGAEEAVEGLSRVVDKAGDDVEMREMALQALASCGSPGRQRLLELSHRPDLVGLVIGALDRAAVNGGFRPAAMERLAAIATDPSVDRRLRGLAMFAVVQGGWAAGAPLLREAAAELGCTDLIDAWEEAGWYVRESTPPEEEAPLFLLDFESTFFRRFGEVLQARERAMEEMQRRVDEECRQRLAAPAEVEVEPVVRAGRNEPCPCGSGKKYKKCCIDKASGPRIDLLAQASRETPLPMRGFRVSPFERPAEEQERLARVAAARAAADVPRRVDGHPYVAWGAALRLQELEAFPRALRLVMEILEDWGAEPGLDYVDVLLCGVMLAAPRAPEQLPPLMELSARHASPWSILEHAMVLRHAGMDLGPFLDYLLCHRADDIGALLAWAAASQGESMVPSEENVALLERLEDLLAQHDELDFAHQAFLRVEAVRSALEEELVAEDGDEAGSTGCAGCSRHEHDDDSDACGSCVQAVSGPTPFEVRPGLALGGETEDEEQALPQLGIDTTSLATYLQADGRAGLIETGLEEPVELLEDASVGPWEKECAVRRQALEVEHRKMEEARRAVHESLVAALRARPEALVLCRLEDGVTWLLPEQAGVELACVIRGDGGRARFPSPRSGPGRRVAVWPPLVPPGPGRHARREPPRHGAGGDGGGRGAGRRAVARGRAGAPGADGLACGGIHAGPAPRGASPGRGGRCPGNERPSPGGALGSRGHAGPLEVWLPVLASPPRDFRIPRDWYREGTSRRDRGGPDLQPQPAGGPERRIRVHWPTLAAGTARGLVAGPGLWRGDGHRHAPSPGHGAGPHLRWPLGHDQPLRPLLRGAGRGRGRGHGGGVSRGAGGRRRLHGGSWSSSPPPCWAWRRITAGSARTSSPPLRTCWGWGSWST